jgi:hypothetical protein
MTAFWDRAPTDSWSDMTVATTIRLADGTGNGVDYTTQDQLTFQLFSEPNIDQYFSSTNSSPTFPLPFGLSAPDLNGDGIPALVLNGYTDNLQPAVIALVQNDGAFTNAGTFLFPDGKSFNVNNTFGDNVVLPGSSLIAAQVAGIDLNGDGFDDIAAVDPNVGQMMLLTTSATPLTTSATETMLELSGGALPEFTVADFGMDGYPDLIVPGGDDSATQTAPVLILNGTINTGAISFTPTNGEVLTGQGFSDFIFGNSTEDVAASSSAGPAGDAVVSGSTSTLGGITIAGRVYIDQNMNSRYSAGEDGLGGVTLYIDDNQSGQFDPAVDPSTTTNTEGYYAFTGLAPGKDYDIAIADLSSSYSASELIVQTPAMSRSGIIERYINVTERWSIPQSVMSIDPLTPIAIELAPLSFRESLGFRPKFELSGTDPSGITIDPFTGEILWAAPDSYAGSSVNVSVRILNLTSPGALETQWNDFQIQVSELSPLAAYIRDVFGALLSRLPTAEELSDWITKLRSGTPLLSFVSTIAHSDERYGILIDEVYLNVLSTEPTSSEYSKAITMLQSGSNSDILAKQLLVSPTFIDLHPSDTNYVDAVNEVLIFKQNTRAMTRREVSWLRRGESRARLVNWISRSHSATMAKARQLSEEYLDGPSNKKVLSEWASALSRGTLNTDSLTSRILASQTYANGWSWRDIPNIQPSAAPISPQYNRLDHMAFGIVGSDASRSELDDIESALYDGQSWQSVAKDVYNSQDAAERRVQAQYQNLLHQTATNNELTTLAATLPAANQSQALQIQILSSSEYRSQFAGTTPYVNSVFQVLTGAVPPLNTALSWMNRLDRGISANQFVRKVSSSSEGRTGQVQRLYRDYLGRAASAGEVRGIFATDPASQLQDRTIALQLINGGEFRLQQRRATLLAVSTPSA